MLNNELMFKNYYFIFELNWIEWIISEKIELLCPKWDFKNIESVKLLWFNEYFFTIWYWLILEIYEFQNLYHWVHISLLKSVIHFNEENLMLQIIK